MAAVEPLPQNRTACSLGGPDATGDDLPGLLPEPGGLQAGARRLGVGVGVEGEDGRADVVLDEAEGPTRGGVVGVDHRSGAEGAVDHLVVADHRAADEGDQVAVRPVPAAPGWLFSVVRTLPVSHHRGRPTAPTPS